MDTLDLNVPYADKLLQIFVDFSCHATTQLAMGRSPLDVQRQMGHTTLHILAALARHLVRVIGMNETIGLHCL